MAEAKAGNQLHMSLEMDAGDVADSDAEAIEVLADRIGEDWEQRLLGIAFDEDHAPREEQLGAGGGEIALDVLELVGGDCQAGERKGQGRTTPRLEMDD